MSHSHLIRNNGVVEPIVGADLQAGMRIPVAQHISSEFINSEIKIGDTMYELDHLFGWFVGAYLAEGNINYHEIAITNISEHFINKTTEFAERFGKDVRVAEKMGEYGQSITTKFTDKALALLLLDTCGTGSFVKRVPDFAFTAPMKFKAGLLQA